MPKNKKNIILSNNSKFKEFTVPNQKSLTYEDRLKSYWEKY